MESVHFDSTLFPLETITLGGADERVLRGGRSLFDRLERAFSPITRIGVIGWGPQASAQAQNLRESLAGTPITVTVGLREGSPSAEAARAAGFTEDDGTLGEMFDVIRGSELVLLLIADAAQAALHQRIFAAMEPGATLGLSHGFLLAQLRSIGEDFPANIDVIAVCPKGMGASVRRLYEQGRETDGAGINASIAVHQDVSGRATDVALGWAVGIGAPYVFGTTLEMEYRSDIVGERAVLLGAVHGIVEAVYRRYLVQGEPPGRAFTRACESLTGPIARLVSSEGMKGVYDRLEGDARRTFEEAYATTYPSALALVAEIYDEVASGNEIRSVVLAGERAGEFPMSEVDGSEMWQVGREVRAGREGAQVPIDPLTAGVFCATMMAQVDLFARRGHCWSEIANESVIEAVDSLIPYMHARGVAYMIDNCSTTARLGARKWGPRYESQLNQVVFPELDGKGTPRDEDLIEDFRTHAVHDVLDTLVGYRPAVDIAVT